MGPHPRELYIRLQPLLVQQKTKRTSRGTILAINLDAYTSIEPITVPTPYQTYLAIALLQPKMSSRIMAIGAYLPQLNMALGKNTYHDLLHWLAQLFNEKHPRLPIILGG